MYRDAFCTAREAQAGRTCTFATSPMAPSVGIKHDFEARPLPVNRPLSWMERRETHPGYSHSPFSTPRLQTAPTQPILPSLTGLSHPRRVFSTRHELIASVDDDEQVNKSLQGSVSFRRPAFPPPIEPCKGKRIRAQSLPVLEPSTDRPSFLKRPRHLRDSQENTFRLVAPKLSPGACDTTYRKGSRKKLRIKELQLPVFCTGRQTIKPRELYRPELCATTATHSGPNHTTYRNGGNLDPITPRVDDKCSHDPENPMSTLKCSNCGKIFQSKSNSKLSRDRCKIEGYHCEACVVMLGKKNSQTNGIMSAGSSRAQQRDEVSKPETKRLFDKGGQEASNTSDCFEVFTCALCYLKFSSRLNINKHIFEVHRRGKGYFCKICKLWFETEGSLDIHKKSCKHHP